MDKLTFPPIDLRAEEDCQKTLDFLAKVPRSLGKLEELAVKLAGMTGGSRPAFARKSVVLFASDHAIARHGLSATGQEVTEIQVRNFLKGGGTINAFARNSKAELIVVDVGIKNELGDLPGLVNRKVMPGARDFSREAAMTRDEALRCIQTGIDMARREADKGTSLLAAGEMGIGNTSPCSAMAAVFLGVPVRSVTGIGSGIDEETMERKIQLIEQGIAVNNPDPKDALDVLTKVGGPEIAAMMGLMIGGASLRIPCVVDGFIAGTAALAAVRMYPEVRNYLIGSHISVEPGHRLLMDHLGLETYFDFGLRLGEGTGAVLFFSVIDAAVRILSEMKTMRDIGLAR